jgi:hypothetical protein
MAELPSSVGLPQEMMLGQLDYSLPPDAKSYSVKVQPSNISSVVSTFSPPLANGVYLPDTPATVQNIIFDIPCGASPSMFLDNRFTTLNFTANLQITSAGVGSGSGFLCSYLRSSGYAYFDRMYITSQNGQIIEDITEFGLLNDTLIALQMNTAVRHGCATSYGFDVGNLVTSQSNDPAVAGGCMGHQWENVLDGQASSYTNTGESHSYSIPLTSGVIGVLADKFLNVGRTSKLQLVLQTSTVLPISMLNVLTTNFTTAPTFQMTISNMSLQCEYIDVGINALQLLDQTLVDGKAYSHGVTYRTSTASLPAGISGSTSLLAGIRASSVKSLFVRFAQGGTAGLTTSVHGKYSSFNPILNGIAFNIGGIKFPQTPINPLLNPSQAFRETQLAMGAWNNSNFQSGIPQWNYCKLSAGTGVVGAVGNYSQDFRWTVGEVAINNQYCNQSQFIFGENTEVCMRRGLLSGLNATSAPIFVELSINNALTNSHTVFVQAMIDQILIHDVRSGDITVRC